MNNKLSVRILKTRQGLPLEAKIILSQRRIQEFHEKMFGDTYISFSGGKDSTVLLHLVREIYPDTPAVFVDTGLEYPEIKEFVKTIDNVTWLRPKMSYKEVLKKYGYPVVSKEVALKIRQIKECPKESKTYILRTTGITSDGRKSSMGMPPKKWMFLKNAPFKISEKCCDVMKKIPFRLYHKQTKRFPYTGVMASDSRQRKINYLKHGCNAFEGKIQSNPLGFWLEEDIWNYIKKLNINYSSIYDKGLERTGCMFCMFGCHLETNDRFEILKKLHPKLYHYCMNELGLKKVIRFINKEKSK